MQRSYHTDAVFSDPVFRNLSSREVKAMWEMLLTSSTDLEVTFKNVEGTNESASCHWEAFYTFTLTGKKIHNIIEAKFVLKHGKIFSHQDDFDLYRWSRMAFGVSGVLLGWSSFMKNKVRGKARKRLQEFMKKKNLP